jgi:hypothetical protein
MATRMPFGAVNKWRALSLKRLSHLADLRQTGRWRRHYASQAAFDAVLRDADADAENWKRLAYYSKSSDAEAVEPLKDGRGRDG